MDDTQVVKALAALAQESRLRLFRHLVVAGPQGATPSQMSEELGISPNLISFHIKELAQAGLVSQEREGRFLIYRPQLQAMNDLLGYLTANCCQGQSCLPSAPLKCTSC